MSPSREGGHRGPLTGLCMLAAVSQIAVFGGLWLSEVCESVTEPYLDEFFHVRQAQVYCEGKFSQWDPKITTPPGLYGISTVINWATGHCDIVTLRASNLVALGCIFLLLSQIKSQLSSRSAEQRPYHHNTIPTAISQIHTAFNMCLFPPLFFLCALYYTDVISTLCVLLTYSLFLSGVERKSTSVARTVFGVISAVVALLFRQTNIFWVAVFPAGLAAVQVLKSLPKRTETRVEAGGNTILQAQDNITLDNKLVSEAFLEDYLWFAVSLVINAVQNAVIVLSTIAPFLAVIGLFGGFVVWNGGVVLGDKSNHIATLHFPQMLYIWPYIIFFSFPIILPYVASGIIGLLPSPTLRDGLRPYFSSHTHVELPRLWVGIYFTALAALAVHFNTIVHPFILADNRHYVFYVFRLLLRHPVVKYLVTPVYVICGWATIQAVGAATFPRLTSKGTQGITPARSRKDKTRLADQSAGPDGCDISFVIIWLITTTLSTVTAPLVEPRYFIIPWIMWRLHAPDLRPTDDSPGSDSGSGANRQDLLRNAASLLWLKYDRRLWFETVWYLLINVVTGYLFLHRTFTWPQEPGSLQRFLW